MSPPAPVQPSATAILADTCRCNLTGEQSCSWVPDPREPHENIVYPCFQTLGGGGFVLQHQMTIANKSNKVNKSCLTIYLCQHTVQGNSLGYLL